MNQTFVHKNRGAAIMVAVTLLSVFSFFANTTSAATNLIPNPSVETQSGALPLNWHIDQWGTNLSYFTYPVQGSAGVGSKAVQVTITKYPLLQGGDAKWYFDPVTVTAGQKYAFSDQYKSTIPSLIVVEFHSPSGSLSYLEIGSVPASSTWKAFSAQFTVPSNVTSLTVFHLIRSVGTLATDNFSLTNASVTSNPVPTTTSILPTSAIQGSPSFTLTVNGTNFINPALTGSGSSVIFNNITVPTTYVSSTQLKAAIPASSIASAGTYQVKVFTAAPGGGTSNIQLFTVNPIIINNPVPTVTSINPNSKIVGDVGFNITVTGTNFISSSVVNFNGSARTTTFVSSTQLTAAIPTSDLLNAGTYNITVTNPAPGGGISNAVTFTINSQTTNNLIPNPSFEIQSGNLPLNWQSGGWGTNATVFSYPVDGSLGTGSKAAQITISSYTDGDAKWYFTPVLVTGGSFYAFSDKYKSNVATSVIVEFHKTDGTLSYQNIGSPVAASNWTTFTSSFTVPVNVTSLTIYHLINSAGTLTVDDYSLTPSSNSNAYAKGMVSLTFDDGWRSIYDNAIPILNAAGYKSTQYLVTNVLDDTADGYIAKTEANIMYNQGHDITAHTRSHPDLTTLSAADLQSQVQGSRNDLLGLSFTPVDSLAYPYGQFNATVEQAAKDAGFTGARTVNQGYNDKATNPFELKGTAVERGGTCDGGAATTSLANVQSWIDSAALSKTWLVLVFHQIDNINANCYGTTPQMLQSIVDYLKTSNVNVVTVSQGLAQK